MGRIQLADYAAKLLTQRFGSISAGAQEQAFRQLLVHPIVRIAIILFHAH